MQAKAEEVIAFAKEVLGESYPAHFVMPKLLILPVKKKQSFGKYAYNMVLQEEAKLAKSCGAEKKALQEKLAVMKANIKIEQPVKGSFFADGGIVIYYCCLLQLHQEVLQIWKRVLLLPKQLFPSKDQFQDSLRGEQLLPLQGTCQLLCIRLQS